MPGEVFTTRPELRGTFGMVASTHWLASAAGMSMLEAGGNAADAAVCAGFVLQVVEPHLNGLGGDVPILVAGPDQALPDVICGQGPVPRLATIEAFRELGLSAVPGSGLLAACVPGAFGAWLRLLRDRGTRSLAAVLAPAIDYAENGYPVVPAIARVIASMAPYFQEHWPSSAEVYLPGGESPAARSLFRNPALAATYRRLVAAAEAAGGDRDSQLAAAHDAFYAGFVAEAIDRFCQSQSLMDSSGAAHGGLLRGDDLADWAPAVEACVAIEFAGHTVCKCGPWSQGPVLLQELQMLEALRIESHEPGSADWVHTIIEVVKLAMADRDAWYADPAGYDVPLADLLAPGYAAERARLVDTRASLQIRPGNPGGRTPVAPAPADLQYFNVSSGSGLREPTLLGVLDAPGDQLHSGDTCHVDVVDRSGMMVSATPSGGWLQSSPVVPGLGFSLGTRAQMTWLDETLASALRPGLRPRTTLSPTMVMRRGHPVLAMGTPGGDQQDQWQLPVLLRLLNHGENLQQAIDAPEFHTGLVISSFDPRTAEPGTLHLESRAKAGGVAEELHRRGHPVDLVDSWSLGRVSAVARDDDGQLRAGANPRGMQGYAVGR